MEGYIKLHRKMKETSFYNNANSLALAIHCLLSANYKDNTIVVDGKPCLIKRGEFITSYAKIALALGLSVQKIRSAFKTLSNTGFLTRSSTHRLTHITVCKFNQYQEIPTQSITQSLTTQQHSPNTVSTTNNKEKKEKNTDNTYTAFEQAVYEQWNSFCEKHEQLSKIVSLSKKRTSHLKARKKEDTFNFAAILAAIPDQPFLLGEGSGGWTVSFDWLIENDTNYLKVLEKKYELKGVPTWNIKPLNEQNEKANI